MRMVSKKFTGKNFMIVAAGLSAASLAAYAAGLSPNMTGAQQALQPLSGMELKCEGPFEGDDNEKKQKQQQCMSQCPNKFNQAKQKAESAMKGAAGKDTGLNAQGSKIADQGAAANSQQDDTMSSAKSANQIGKGLQQQKAANFGSLSQAMKQCEQTMENVCSDELLKGEDKETVEKAKQACGDAGKQADAGKQMADKQAEQMAKDEKKDDKNGQGMQPPQMPQMPQQQDKPSQVASNTNTATSTPVAPSGLGGNQLGNNSMAIGGEEKKTDPTTSTALGYGGRNFGGSGISTGDDKKFGAHDFGGGGGATNGSGASSMGGGFGSLGGSGSGDGAAKTDAQAAAVPAQKPEDIEAFSNGGARPSYLGMKSKGGELSDLGLDGAAGGGALPAGDAGAGDRSLASTEQNSGIHGEDEMGGSVFNMIHTKLQEIGRRGSI